MTSAMHHRRDRRGRRSGRHVRPAGGCTGVVIGLALAGTVNAQDALDIGHYADLLPEWRIDGANTFRAEQSGVAGDASANPNPDNAFNFFDLLIFHFRKVRKVKAARTATAATTTTTTRVKNATATEKPAGDNNNNNTHNNMQTH